MTFFNQIRYGPGRYFRGGHLFFQIIPEGVASQGNNYPLLHICPQQK
jgi:hypothetical protein